MFKEQVFFLSLLYYFVFENKSRAGMITLTSLRTSSSGILAAFKAAPHPYIFLQFSC